MRVITLCRLWFMPSLSEPEFQRLADRFLVDLLDACDAQLPDGSGADLNGGVLTIDTPRGQYVLNKHAPLRQLWLSSPASGAWHFEWREGEWAATRDPIRLQQLLMREIDLAL